MRNGSSATPAGGHCRDRGGACCSAPAVGERARARTQTCASRWARPGEAQHRASGSAVAAQFEAAQRRGRRSSSNFQDDDLYQTIGLPERARQAGTPRTSTSSGPAAGWRSATRTASPPTCTERTRPGRWPASSTRAVLPAASVDGKVVLVPHTADVTNVLWYNMRAPRRARHRRRRRRWDELLAACDALAAADVIPIATGNKDLWAAGNWLAHLVSRVVGEESTTQLLGGDAEVLHPRVGAGVRLHRGAARSTAASTRAPTPSRTTRARSCSSRARPRCTPSARGWSSWAIDDAPDLEFDFVNLPAMPEGSAGDQGSVIGVETGYIVNAKSPKHRRSPWSSWRCSNSPDNVKRFVTDGRDHPHRDLA